MKRYKSKFESIEIPLEKGDSFRYGKFKNKTAIYDSSYINDKGDLIIKTDDGKEIGASKIRLIQEEEFHLSLTPTSNGKFGIWDYIGKQRVYKKGTTSPIYFNNEKDAKEYAIKYMNKKYGKNDYRFEENEKPLYPFMNRESYDLYYNYEKQWKKTLSWDSFVRENKDIFNKETLKIKNDLNKIKDPKRKQKKFEYEMLQLKTQFISVWDILKNNKLKESYLKEEHFSPFKAWYFPDKDEFIKFPTNKDYREYVDNYVSAMKGGAVRIHAFDSEVEIETKHNPDSRLYSKVLNTLAKKIHNFKYVISHIDWFASGDKQVFNLQEDLHLSDFVKHSGVSDFTKKFMKDRQRLKGAGNISAKIRSLKINRKKGYITFTFISKPTYTNKTKAVDPNTLAFKNARAYEQHIRLVDFFKYAETKPGYKENELTWKEVKEIIQVCPIQVWCNCGSYEFQGMAYIDTLFDAAIYPEYRAPKRWNLYHNDDNFACKHLDILFTSGINLFIQNMTSMINKILKGTK